MQRYTAEAFRSRVVSDKKILSKSSCIMDLICTVTECRKKILNLPEMFNVKS